MSRSLGAIGLARAFVAQPTAGLAQEAKGETPTITAEQALANADELWSGAIDIKTQDPCATTNDPDVIIVCRRWQEGEQYMIERPTRADMQVSGSGAPRPPDFSVSCLRDGGGSVCMRIGSAPPPAFMVDFDALPEGPSRPWISKPRHNAASRTTSTAPGPVPSRAGASPMVAR